VGSIPAPGTNRISYFARALKLRDAARCKQQTLARVTAEAALGWK
jgi:hypothetical protein